MLSGEASANKLQELGRSYGLLAINRQQRGARTAKFNKSFGTTAMQLNEVGNQMASAVDQINTARWACATGTQALIWRR